MTDDAVHCGNWAGLVLTRRAAERFASVDTVVVLHIKSRANRKRVFSCCGLLYLRNGGPKTERRSQKKKKDTKSAETQPLSLPRRGDVY